MRTLALVIVMLFSLTAPATPHGYGAGKLVVAHPYSHPISAGATAAAGYVVLMNNGAVQEHLTGVETSFGAAQLHETQVIDGVASMRPAKRFTIPPNSILELEPGGQHIMLTGLKGHALEPGDTFTVTLHFENAGAIEVEFWIQPRNSTDKSHMGH